MNGEINLSAIPTGVTDSTIPTINTSAIPTGVTDSTIPTINTSAIGTGVTNGAIPTINASSTPTTVINTASAVPTGVDLGIVGNTGASAGGGSPSVSAGSDAVPGILYTGIGDGNGHTTPIPPSSYEEAQQYFGAGSGGDTTQATPGILYTGIGDGEGHTMPIPPSSYEEAGHYGFGTGSDGSDPISHTGSGTGMTPEEEAAFNGKPVEAVVNEGEISHTGSGTGMTPEEEAAFNGKPVEAVVSDEELAGLGNEPYNPNEEGSEGQHISEPYNPFETSGGAGGGAGSGSASFNLEEFHNDVSRGISQYEDNLAAFPKIATCCTNIANTVQSEDSNLAATLNSLSEISNALYQKCESIKGQLYSWLNQFVTTTETNEADLQKDLVNYNTEFEGINSELNALVGSSVGNGGAQ